MSQGLTLRVVDHLWLVSILPERWRFYAGTDEGYRTIHIDRVLLHHCLNRVWEQDILAEMIDPEWPCKYWEEIEDLK